MTIYVINETYVSGEDYYSRDEYSDRLIEEAGYFTDRAEAEAYIEQAINDSMTKHAQRVKDWEQRRDEQQKKRDDLMAVYNTLVEEIQKKGYEGDSLRPPILPGDPAQPVYNKPDLNIVELEKHNA